MDERARLALRSQHATRGAPSRGKETSMRPLHLTRSIGLLVAFVTGAMFAVPVLGAPAVAAVTAGQTGPGGVAPLSAAEATSLSTNVVDRVIVLLKDQVTALPDTPAHATERTKAVADAQAPFLAELKQTHATDVTTYSLINAFA